MIVVLVLIRYTGPSVCYKSYYRDFAPLLQLLLEIVVVPLLQLLLEVVVVIINVIYVT